MTTPILVFGAMGAGASIMIWTIKKILWPNMNTNNPLCPLNTAHNQPLCEHWHGIKPLTDIYNGVPKHQQIIHAEPEIETMTACLDYPSVFIHAHDYQSIKETAQLTKIKLSKHFDHCTMEEIQEMLARRNNYLCLKQYENLPNVLYLTFHDLAHGDLEYLLNQLYSWLGVQPGTRHNTVVTIIQRWRQGNQKIWNQTHQ